MIFTEGQKKSGCQSCNRLYHPVGNKILLKNTIRHKELNSGVRYSIKADRCVQVQHEKQRGGWEELHKL